MLHDLGWRDLSDRWQDLRLALLYKVVTGHVAIGPDQIGLKWLRITEPGRIIGLYLGASSSGLRNSFAARTVSD